MAVAYMSTTNGSSASVNVYKIEVNIRNKNNFNVLKEGLLLNWYDSAHTRRFILSTSL